MIIFVLHGFQGATPNRKTEVLRKYAKPHIVVGLNYTYSPIHSVNDLYQQIDNAMAFHDTKECVFLGTSLGGFWAQFLSVRYQVKGILINPAIEPWDSLHKHIGICQNVVTNGAFNLSEDDVDSHRAYKKQGDEGELLVLLDKGDELFDYRHTLRRFLDYQSVRVWDGGEHSFAHLKDAMYNIINFIEGEQMGNDDERKLLLDKALSR